MATNIGDDNFEEEDKTVVSGSAAFVEVLVDVPVTESDAEIETNEEKVTESEADDEKFAEEDKYIEEFEVDGNEDGVLEEPEEDNGGEEEKDGETGNEEVSNSLDYVAFEGKITCIHSKLNFFKKNHPYNKLNYCISLFY